MEKQKKKQKETDRERDTEKKVINMKYRREDAVILKYCAVQAQSHNNVQYVCRRSQKNQVMHLLLVAVTKLRILLDKRQMLTE